MPSGHQPKNIPFVRRQGQGHFCVLKRWLHLGHNEPRFLGNRRLQKSASCRDYANRLRQFSFLPFDVSGQR